MVRETKTATGFIFFPPLQTPPCANFIIMDDVKLEEF